MLATAARRACRARSAATSTRCSTRTGRLRCCAGWWPHQHPPPMAERTALGGTLVLGGGFAGGYVARLLGKRGATIVSPENFMLFTPLLPEAASGTLEPRHVVVPLRLMCPHAELLSGGDGRRHRRAARRRSRRTRGGDARLRASSSSPSARSSAHAADPRPRRSWARLQVTRRRDPPAQPRPAAARGSGRAARSTTRQARADLRLRRRGLRGRRGAGRALRPRARRAALLPDLRDAPQRWVLVDAAPKILPEIPTRLGDYAARATVAARGRHPRRHDARVGRRRHAASSPTAAGFRRARSSGRPACRRNPLRRLGLPLDDRGRVVVDELLASRACSTCGRSATARASPNQATPGRPIRPPASTRSARPGAWRRTYRRPQAVSLPDARPGGHARPLQGNRRRARPPLARLPRLVRHAVVPPVPASAATRKLRVVADWTTSLFFRRDIAELSMLGHPDRLGP